MTPAASSSQRLPTLDDEERLAAWRNLQWTTSLIMGRFAADLARSGLTLEEFDVLVHLAWSPDGVLPLRRLVSSLVLGHLLTRSGLTRILDRMERDGLVTRTLSASDRRQFDVTLTRSGRAVFDSVWAEHVEGLRRYFMDPLTDDDVRALRAILAKLIAANEAEARAARGVAPVAEEAS